VVAKVLLSILIRLFFNPKVLWRLEIIAENRYYFTDLVICVPIHEEIGVDVCIFGFFTAPIQIKFDFQLSLTAHWLLAASEALVLVVRIELLDFLGQGCGELQDLHACRHLHREVGLLTKHELLKGNFRCCMELFCSLLVL